VIVDEQIKTKLINHTLLALQLRGAFAFETTAVHGLIALVGPLAQGRPRSRAVWRINCQVCSAARGRD
jgi:hypothetical protein